MGCLSNVDIENELGKNIYLYPLKLGNITASTINLTSSKFAWSIGQNKSSALSKDGKEIIIPSNDTVLVETEEVIYVTNKICGDYHSRVRLVSKGIGHIGTTLDPLYIGPSLIALHNQTSKDVRIGVNEKIVSLMLYYMTSESTKNHNNSSGHLEILNECEGFEELDNYLDQGWCKNIQELKIKMIESDEYKKLDNARESKRLEKIDKEKKSPKHIVRYFIAYSLYLIFLALIIYAVYKIENRFSDPKSNLPFTNFIVFTGFSGILIPVFYKSFKFIKKLVDRRVENERIED